MATGSQVPWTDPGGTPCCCDSCPTNDEGPDANVSPGTYIDIAALDYENLIFAAAANNLFTLDISVNLQGISNDGLGFIENATANYTGVALQTRSAVAASRPCYNQLTTVEPLLATHTTTNPDGTSGIVTRAIGVNLTYALATINGQTKISLANAQDASGNGINDYTINIGSTVGFDLPINTYLVVASSGYELPLPVASGVAVSFNLVTGLNTYAAGGNVRAIYYYDPGYFDGTVTGSISATLRFALPAP